MIKFNVETILQPLSIVASVVNGKGTLPILDKILWEGDSNKIRFTGSDGETWITMETECVDSNEKFSFCVDAYLIVKTLRSLNGLTVELTIQNDQIVGKYGKDGVFKLPVVGGSEYVIQEISNVKNGTLVEINAQRFLRSIKLCEFACADDELRPILNGIHFMLDIEKMSCAASDGHKLVLFDDFDIKGTQGVSEFTLHKKPSKIISNVLFARDGDITLQFSERNIKIYADGFCITTKCIEGKAPNFRSVIPQARQYKAKVNKNALLSTLSRILPLGDTSTELVIVEFDKNNMNMKSESTDWATSGTESCECEFNYNVPIKVGFKGSLFVQIVKNINSEDIMIEFWDNKMSYVFMPCVQEDNTDYISLLMPMNISQ